MNEVISVLEIRTRNRLAIFEHRISCRLIFNHFSIENVQEIWPTIMDFSLPNAEIGRK